VAAFSTKTLPRKYDAIAPDGSEVRILFQTGVASTAHFHLDAGCVSRAVMHATIVEIWYFLTGSGEFWRRNAEGQESSVEVGPGVCITIPSRTRFQFKALGAEPLTAFGVTMPPWPGSGEREVQAVKGPWTPRLPEGR
jgi:mannose-6-phosphate isomerase-like protein (cupin superfamily)